MSRFFVLLLYALTVWSCGQPKVERAANINANASPSPVANFNAETIGPAATQTPVVACPTFTPTPLPAPGPMPEPLYGVTVEEVENYTKGTQGDIGKINKRLEPLRKSLGLSRRPTLRLIFNPFDDFNDELDTYHKIAQSLRPHAYLMGEILDSKAVPRFDTSCYLYRTARYVNDVGRDVDIWEVGNEINGGWVRKHENEWSEDEAKEVRDKMYGAYRIVKDAGGKTALTLYYNDDHKGNHCWDFKREEMFSWAQEFVPPDMKENLDYVLISFYEYDPGKDCRNQDSHDGEDQQFDEKRLKQWRKKPLDPDWVRVFSDLAVMFPKARIGFGECGTQDGRQKKAQLTKYYKDVDRHLRATLPAPYRERYVGGYFWWYFGEDMVPKNELWGHLDDLLKDGPVPR